MKGINDSLITALVKKAGKMLLDAKLSSKAIHEKEGIANFCTDFDLEIQRFLIDGLSKILPGAAFYGEEETEKNGREQDSEYIFYIDPIDGTTNFIYNYNFSCISVGLSHNGSMIAGFVYNPYADEMFTAVRGEGAFVNGRKLYLEDSSVSDGIVAFGCARYHSCDVDLLFSVMKELFLNSVAIREGGSAALDLCRISAASNVAYLELKLQPYDYAAASVILEEAGGVITQAGGEPITFSQPCSVVAGTKKAHGEILKTIRKYRDRG